MRFRGFSKSNFSVRFAALALVGAFVASLGVVALPSEAEAGRRNVWSVKFKCSTLDTNVIQLDTDTFDAGEFFIQTFVNIHNPNGRDAKFKKKFVIIATQHDTKSSDKTSQSSPITLSANLGHAIDCEDIRDRLDDDVTLADFSSHDESGDDSELIEGWVVIESKRGAKIPELAVCANYFAAVWDDANNKGGGVSEETVCYDPIRVRFKKSNPFQLF